MPAKFVDKASVKVVTIKNPHLDAKYPDIEQFASQTGKVIHSHYVGQSNPYDEGGKKETPWMYYIYVVRLNKDGTFVTIPEDALTIAK